MAAGARGRPDLAAVRSHHPVGNRQAEAGAGSGSTSHRKKYSWWDRLVDEIWGGRIVSESAISARIAAARKKAGLE